MSEFTVTPAVVEDVAPAATPDRPGRVELVDFPLTFLGLWWLSSTGAGGLLRVLFGMWLHELGHASAAWLCGYGAVPLPWVTMRSDRSWLVTAVVFLALGALARLGWRRRSGLMLGLAGAGLAMALIGHLLSPASQQALFAFSGDAGAMGFGAMLASASLLASSHRLLRGGLRFGWLVIGAASWADATRVWWRARWDPGEIPFGVESFGFGGDGILSDASRLVDECGWDARTMVTRFLIVAGLSLLGCVVAFVVSLRRDLRRERHLV